MLKIMASICISETIYKGNFKENGVNMKKMKKNGWSGVGVGGIYARNIMMRVAKLFWIIISVRHF